MEEKRILTIQEQEKVIKLTKKVKQLIKKKKYAEAGNISREIEQIEFGEIKKIF